MKVCLLSHISNSYAPTYPFQLFLKSRSDDVFSIFHPLIDSGIQITTIEKKNKKKYIRFSNVNFFSYFLNFIINLKHCLIYEKFDIIFGLNPLNTFSAIILKFLGRTKLVVYYYVDYSENNFNNYIVNFLYKCLDKICYKYADCCFCVSKRIIKKKSNEIKKKNVFHQPNGVFLQNINNQKKNYSKKIKIVFSGNLVESKGINQIIEALNTLKNKKNFSIDIYGDGIQKKKLISKIKKRGLQKNFKFKGIIKNENYLRNLKNYDVGLALYNSKETHNFYCDPVKIREYMAAKLIIITTNIPEISKYIQQKKIGYVIKENDKSGLNKILNQISSKKLRFNIKKNYEKLKLTLDWFDLFDNNMNKVKKILNDK